MQSKAFPTRQRGLSLIECCMTLAIASILVGTAAPSFIEFNKKRVFDGSTNELVTDLYFARSAATAHQEGVRVSFQAVATGSCMLVHTGATLDCTCDSAGAAQCSNGATLIKANYYSTARGINVAANVASIRFDPTHGMATPAGTVRVTTSSGQAVNHIVNITGRVRSCSPGGSVKGYKPC